MFTISIEEDNTGELAQQEVEKWKAGADNMARLYEQCKLDNAQLEAALKIFQDGANWKVYPGLRGKPIYEWAHDSDPRTLAAAALAPEPAATWKPEDGWEAGEDAVRAIREAERGAREGE